MIAEGHVGGVLRRLDEVTELWLLDEDDTDALFALTLANRDFLRRWLNWLDDLGTADDTRRRISRSRTELRNGEGLRVGIWLHGRLTARPRWATGWPRSTRARGS